MSSACCCTACTRERVRKTVRTSQRSRGCGKEGATSVAGTHQVVLGRSAGGTQAVLRRCSGGARCLLDGGDALLARVAQVLVERHLLAQRRLVAFGRRTPAHDLLCQLALAVGRRGHLRLPRARLGLRGSEGLVQCLLWDRGTASSQRQSRRSSVISDPYQSPLRPSVVISGHQ